MVFLDSNIFLVDRFFTGDALYRENRRLVEGLSSVDAAVSVFTLLEICGAASFRLSPRELERWLFGFASVYRVLVVDPFGIEGKDATTWWNGFFSRVSENVSQRMTLGDALLLEEAQAYRAQAILTWNVKDFGRHSRIPVLTPTAFLSQRRSGD